MMLFWMIIITVVFLNRCLEGESFIVPGEYAHTNALYSSRASSNPYISGDTFRAVCDFVIDEKKIPFDPSLVKEGDTIFLNPEYMEFFFSVIHPRITVRYILVTHNADEAVPGKFYSYLDDNKIVAWFGQNISLLDHPKLFPLPIGIANKHWPHGNVHVYNNIRSHVDAYVKNNLLYMNFTLSTQRSLVYNLFKNVSFCLVAQDLSHERYLQDMGCSKFVLSPEGNGIDCHRTWETLLMGSIPVVKHSTIDKVFDGLPVILIDDWREVTQDFLEQEYAQMSCKKYNMERLFIGYWLDQIQQMKNKVANSQV